MSLSKIFVNNQDTGFEGIPLQETGQSTERSMSQKAVTNEFGNLLYLDTDVDSSSPDYNRILLDKVPLYNPSKNLIINLSNNTGAPCVVRFYNDDTLLWYEETSNKFALISEDVLCNKVMLYFNSDKTPIGHIKLECYTEPSVYFSIAKNELENVKKIENSDNKIRQKADVDVGINLVDPEKLLIGKYITSYGSIGTTNPYADYYAISDYIPVNGQNIISNCLKFSYASSYAVYDGDFNLRRVILNESTQYTYENGDVYVRIGFNTANTGCYANYGNDLQVISFTKYEHYDSLKKEFKSYLNINDINNGSKNISVNALEMNAAPTYYEAIDDNSFIYKSALSTAACWCASKVFQPDLSSQVHIKAKATLIQGTERDFNMWVSPSLAYDSQKTMNYHSFSFPSGTDEIDVDISFDPQYFVVYKGFTTDFSIWLLSNGDGTTVTKIQFNDFAIYQLIEEQIFNNFSGQNLTDIFHSIDEAFPSNIDVVDNESFKISPNGTKFILQVSNNGEIVSIPVIPNKAHYFGNSLLSGNTFGMAASDQYHDYYYLINNYILENNPNYISDKDSVGEFERAETIETARAQIQSLVRNLSGDEDLIFVQIGDNVSLQNLENVFSTSFKEFILAIRNVCQSARVIIFGCWYGSTTKINLLSQVAKETGSLFINILDINIQVNRSYIGAIQKRTYSAGWTLENVTNIVDNGQVKTGYAHNITVTFTVSGDSYNSVVDCTSYTLNGTTLQYYSDYYIIPNSGIGSHPGDSGFKAIVNRILYKSDMVDVENYLT